MTDWQDIYRSLDPKQPLHPGDGRLERELYTNDFLDNVRTLLQLNAGTHYKLLLSGHTGCGKSTFLNLLADDPGISGQFHVVRYSIKDLLDVNDIDHVDLLLSIAAQALVSVGEEKLRSSQRLADKAEALAAQLQGLMVVEKETAEAHKDSAGAEVGAKLGVWGFLSSKLFLRYQYEKQTRDKVREKYRADITEFLDLIDSLLLELRSQVGKPILVLIDDTDKIPPEKGLELFYANGHHLAHPKADILFVVDLSLATSSRYPAIRAKFNGEEFFPAIKIRDKYGHIADSCRPARNMLAELAGKRIPAGAMEEDALELAIDACGGVVRELIRLLQYAVFEAKGAVRKSHVQHASRRIANEFNLHGRHTRILRRVLEDPDWLAKEDDGIDEEVLLELLHMPALFQYRNGDIKWYRPYPVFIDWLKGLSAERPG